MCILHIWSTTVLMSWSTIWMNCGSFASGNFKLLSMELGFIIDLFSMQSARCRFKISLKSTCTLPYMTIWLSLFKGMKLFAATNLMSSCITMTSVIGPVARGDLIPSWTSIWSKMTF